MFAAVSQSLKYKPDYGFRKGKYFQLYLHTSKQASSRWIGLGQFSRSGRPWTISWGWSRYEEEELSLGRCWSPPPQSGASSLVSSSSVRCQSPRPRQVLLTCCQLPIAGPTTRRMRGESTLSFWWEFWNCGSIKDNWGLGKVVKDF